MEYKTNQKELLLSILYKEKGYSISAPKILKLVDGKISKATVYRLLNLFEDNGTIRKTFNELSSNYEYQYIENDCSNNHFHLKCISCGKLIHLPCKDANEFIAHIYKQHKFSVNNNLTTIYGICSDCSLLK